LEQLLLEWLSVDGLLLFGVGIFAAIMGVMFGAAGFVLVPGLMLLGIPIHSTVAVNKFATGVSSLSAVIELTIKKKVPLKQMLPLMCLAALGGISGAFLATRLSEQTMTAVACIVLIVMFFVVLKSNKGPAAGPKNTGQAPSSLAPFFIGIYDGGFGPGSALLNITYFMKKKFSYVKAAQMTRFVMFASCISAFLFYYFYGIVNWGAAIPVTAGSIVGSHIGLHIIPYLKAKWVQVLLPVIFLLLIVQVVADSFFS